MKYFEIHKYKDSHRKAREIAKLLLKQGLLEVISRDNVYFRYTFVKQTSSNKITLK